MKAIIVFDADNTLWDTNAVFKDAQISLLRVFAEAGLLNCPDTELDNLRNMDRVIINRLGRFEYDFTWLANAAGHFYSGERNAQLAVESALRRERSVDEEIIEKSSEVFAQVLRNIPPLLPDARRVLHILKRSGSRSKSIVLMLFSDGQRMRIERILKAHNLMNSTFDAVIIQEKCIEAFKEVRFRGFQLLPGSSHSRALAFMIGDSLKRDIAPANAAGFFTIYKSARFWGEEIVSNKTEEPSERVQSLLEIPAILERLGIITQRTTTIYVKKAAAAGNEPS